MRERERETKREDHGENSVEERGGLLKRRKRERE